jgi:hypothetical protein
MERKQPEKQRDPQKPLNYPKKTVTHIMDEVLLDAVDVLLKYTDICKEIQKEGGANMADRIEETSEKLHLQLLDVEKDLCQLRGIDLEKYYEDVTFYDNANDVDIKSRLDKLAKYIEGVLKGDSIKVEFPISPELTKEMTLNLYKIILISHLHLFYMGIQKLLKENPKATLEEITGVIEQNEDGKIKRR